MPTEITPHHDTVRVLRQPGSFGTVGQGSADRSVEADAGVYP
jgi:hypothetical protein